MASLGQMFAPAPAAPAAMKEVAIVRHGPTEMNNQNDMSEDRIRGWKDIPLSNPEGIEAAHKAAADLMHYAPFVVVSSDLKRAAQTGEIIANINHSQIHYTPLLRPWNLGRMQGQVTKTALPIIHRYVCEFPDEPVPEGESFHSFTNRAFRGLQYAINLAGDTNLVIVTHHRDERLFFSWRDGGFDPQQKIHLKTFLAVGEAPGAVQMIEIPLASLFPMNLGASNVPSENPHPVVHSRTTPEPDDQSSPI